MSRAARREAVLQIDNTAGDGADWAVGYTVYPFKPGAVASAASSGFTATVYEGHNFKPGDKCVINPGTDNTLVSIRGLGSDVTATTLRFTTQPTIAKGDVIFNLEDDTGSSNLDGTSMTIYDGPDRTDAISGNKVVSSSLGEYAYYHTGGSSIWELITDASAAIVGYVIDAFSLDTQSPGTFEAADFATGGSGTSADPWTGWEDQLSSYDTSTMLRVHFARGYFETDQANVFNRKVWLDGEGTNATFIYTTNADGDLFNFNSSSGIFRISNMRLEPKTNALNADKPLLNFVAAESVVIDNVWIDETGVLAANGTAVAIANVDQATVRDLVINGSSSDVWAIGIECGNGITADRGPWAVIGGTMDYVAIGIRSGAGTATGESNISVTGMRFRRTDSSGTEGEVGSSAIQLAGQFAATLVVTGCWFERYERAIELQSFVSVNPVVVTGCTFNEFNQSAEAQIDLGVLWLGSVFSTGNVFRNASAGGTCIDDNSAAALVVASGNAAGAQVTNYYLKSGTNVAFDQFAVVNALRIGVSGLQLEDGITAPGTVSGQAQLYVDTADGDLKVKFGDGFVAVIAADS